MGLMDSIDIQYVWKAIQESERSDEISYLNTALSDRLFQACHSARPQAGIRCEPERGDSEESRLKPDASSPSRR
jgi:hypothetical protein